MSKKAEMVFDVKYDLFGEIASGANLEEFKECLADTKLRVEVRNEINVTIHYETLRIKLERISHQIYLIKDWDLDSSNFDLLEEVSKVLSTLNIRHRLEVYETGTNNLVHYFHHNWSKT